MTFASPVSQRRGGARHNSPNRYTLWMCASEEAASASSAGAPLTAIAASEPALLPLRVLIIEDNRDYAEGLQVFLELHGHEAVLAFTGSKGVEAALRQPPDVVICDIGLPGMNGFEVARALRRDSRTAGARIIAVTGYGTDRDREYATECGFDAHLLKPVEASEILRCMRRAQ